MAKLQWDVTGERFYETGVSQGVLYLRNSTSREYDEGHAWNGLSAVTESPSGAEPTPIWGDNQKYLNLMSAEEFGATVEAYTYPDAFAKCDGSAELVTGVMIGQQERSVFGMAYTTIKGNDTEGNAHGRKIHLIYGAQAAPSERNYQTVNDSPEPVPFSWELSTTPVNVTGHKPVSSLVIDTTKADPTKLAELEKILYGDEMTEPRLPLPNEIKTLLTPAEE